MLKLFSFLPQNWVHALSQGLALFRNRYCIGVRVLVFSQDGQVLLVRHTYLTGWYLPGGGVDVGETLDQAAVRELREEAGVEAQKVPQFLGMYLNKAGLGRDHVGLFKVTDWQPGAGYLASNEEIAEVRFFPTDALPEDASKATRARVMEHEQRAKGADGPLRCGIWGE